MKNSLVRNIVLVAGLFVLLFALQLVRSPQAVQQKKITKIAVTPTPTAAKPQMVSYTGEEGVDALTLLEEKYRVEKESSGLVVSIDGRKANNTQHEYWAFYVNGKLADVGPHDYVTNDTDKIEWKIEKY